jgi:multidrug efflux pump
MIGVTAFGIFLTPVFYVALRALGRNRELRHHGAGSFDLKPLPMKETE